MYDYTFVGQYPQINDDLVNSHHLLLCCIDMLYCIALVNKRRDLLNLECPFLAEDWATTDYQPHDLPSILPQLCSKYNGKKVKVHLELDKKNELIRRGGHINRIECRLGGGGGGH